ncbi:MAG: hypothetical protein WEB52_15845 [Dehalococcoidia bacterium]
MDGTNKQDPPPKIYRNPADLSQIIRIMPGDPRRHPGDVRRGPYVVVTGPKIEAERSRPVPLAGNPELDTPKDERDKETTLDGGLRGAVLSEVVDYDLWLWEVFSESKRLFRDQPDHVNQRLSALTVAEMVQENLVVLVRGNRFKGQLDQLYSEEAVRLIMTEESWRVPVTDQEELQIRITDVGSDTFLQKLSAS